MQAFGRLSRADQDMQRASACVRLVEVYQAAQERWRDRDFHQPVSFVVITCDKLHVNHYALSFRFCKSLRTRDTLDRSTYDPRNSAARLENPICRYFTRSPRSDGTDTICCAYRMGAIPAGPVLAVRRGNNSSIFQRTHCPASIRQTTWSHPFAPFKSGGLLYLLSQSHQTH